MSLNWDSVGELELSLCWPMTEAPGCLRAAGAARFEVLRMSAASDSRKGCSRQHVQHPSAGATVLRQVAKIN